MQNPSETDKLRFIVQYGALHHYLSKPSRIQELMIRDSMTFEQVCEMLLSYVDGAAEEVLGEEKVKDLKRYMLENQVS